VSDVDRLLAAFEAGELVRPDTTEPGLVDLARAIATIADVPDIEATDHSRALEADIGPAEHLVFILVDGLGASALEAESGAPFMREHRVRQLHSTFPSTTAVALTSLATGAWPADHGIVGWWTHLPALADAVTVLPFTRRIDDRPLQELDIEAADAFPLPSLWQRATRDAACVQPERIAGSIYSAYALGGRACMPYRSLREAFDAVISHVEDAGDPSYTYLYLPHVDGAAHEYGLNSPEVHGAITAIDRELARCAETLQGAARIVLTSDHGHLGAPPEHRHPIRNDDALGSRLACLPSGDLRCAVFHVRPGQTEDFAAAFRLRFGERFALLTAAEVEELRLLGPTPLSEETRRRLGDFMAISLGADILAYVTAGGDRHALHQPSHHSGMCPDEVLIPLVLA